MAGGEVDVLSLWVVVLSEVTRVVD